MRRVSKAPPLTSYARATRLSSSERPIRVAEAIAGQRVLIEPNSPSAGVLVAMIEVNGAPVELMQVDRQLRPDV